MPQHQAKQANFCNINSHLLVNFLLHLKFTTNKHTLNSKRRDSDRVHGLRLAGAGSCPHNVPHSASVHHSSMKPIKQHQQQNTEAILSSSNRLTSTAEIAVEIWLLKTGNRAKLWQVPTKRCLIYSSEDTCIF